jgi:transcriptional regulator with XRE-family HTH domain
MNLGQQISILRKKNKISQNELGKKVGTSGDIIGRYERNEVSPSIDVVVKIADILNVSIDYLVGKTDIELDNKILNRIIEIQKLPEEEKKSILFNLDAVLRDAKTRQAYS